MFTYSLDVDRNDIMNHPDVLKYFKIRELCEKRHKSIIARSRGQINDLRVRARVLGVHYARVAFFFRTFKDYNNDELYRMVLAGSNNAEVNIRYKQFIYECFDTLRNIQKEKLAVKLQNLKDKREISKTLKSKGIRIGIVAFAYKQMVDKTKFYINEVINENVDLNEYKYLDSFINAYVQKNIKKYQAMKAEADKKAMTEIHADFRRQETEQLEKLTEEQAIKIAGSMYEAEQRIKKDIQDQENVIYAMFGYKRVDDEFIPIKSA